MTHCYLGNKLQAKQVIPPGCVLSPDSEQVNMPQALPATKAFIKRCRKRLKQKTLTPAFGTHRAKPCVAHAVSLVRLTMISGVGANDVFGPQIGKARFRKDE